MTSGANGATGHADFVNGWSEQDLTTLMHLAYWSHCQFLGNNYGPRKIGVDHDDPAWTGNC